jgi:hypothetical protein
MSLKTLDPSKGKCLVGGIPLSGFSDNIIEIEYDEETYTLDTGADGESTRILNKNQNGKVTIYLKQSSTSNDVLNALATKDRLDGSGVVPFLFTDLSGRTVAAAAQAYITKPPKYGFGKEIKEHAWVLQLINLKLSIGGNS